MTRKVKRSVFDSDKTVRIFACRMLLVLLWFSLPGYANDSTMVPKKPVNMQVQYAGNMGLVSVGAGKSYLYNKLNIYTIYGFLPKEINGASVHTLALKAAYTIAVAELSDNLLIDCYTGIAALYGITRNTYVRYPDYFPDGYYGTNALHATFFLGARFKLDLNHPRYKTISLFTELGTLDYYLWYAIKNKYIKLYDIWNLSFGALVTLGRL